MNAVIILESLRIHVGTNLIKSVLLDHNTILEDQLEQILNTLAMCFLKKGQTDMAIMQLETARDAIPTMDDLKKKVVYQLGLCAEQSGDLEKAYQYYKDVYSTDVGFEDLGERMLAVSQAIKNAQQS